MTYDMKAYIPDTLVYALFGWVVWTRFIGGSDDERESIRNRIKYDGQFVWEGK